MNYLAHAFLSFGEPDILAGQMISDFVKGRKKFDYDKSIQNGIVLHRLIDAFTDVHAATGDAKQFFKPAVGLYAGAFVDVAYDHFLALDETLHSADELAAFAQKTYQQLDAFTDIFPTRFAGMFPYMKSQNWLYNYRTVQGIENSFGGLVRRAAYLNDSTTAFDAFMKYYDALKQCYDVFFPDVLRCAGEQLHFLMADG